MILSQAYNNILMKYFLIISLFLIFSLDTFAQNRTGRGEQIEAYKIGFLTQKLDLTAQEAKIFWPIYNSWQKEQAEFRKDRGQKLISFRKIEEIEELSDAEIQNLIINDFTFKQRELDLEKKYYNKLKSSLPIKTVGKFYRAQEAFKRELLARYRGNGARTQSN